MLSWKHAQIKGAVSQCGNESLPGNFDLPQQGNSESKFPSLHHHPIPQEAGAKLLTTNMKGTCPQEPHPQFAMLGIVTIVMASDTHLHILCGRDGEWHIISNHLSNIFQIRK